jgi:Acyl-CoA synthetases (AMP-forming)/AMP-acid ligases II
MEEIRLYLTELLIRQRINKKVALKQNEESITYSEWYNNSKDLSRKIKDLIDNESRNIAIFLPNSINYAIAYFGILFANKVIIPIGTQSKRTEIVSTIKYCEIDEIVTSLSFKDYLLESLSEYEYRISILFIEDCSTIIVNDNKNLIHKSDLQEVEGNEHDVAVMLHTSGTTSNPKRVMLTHNNLINNVESNILSLNLTKNDKVLISMPMHFGYCNTAQFLTHLYLGASIVILKEIFLPKIFFQTVRNEGITNFTGVPTMLLMLLDYRYVDKYDISSLRYICFGGGNMPVEKLKQLIHKFNTVGFVQTYGQTEASPRTTALLPKDALRKVGSVGQPIPNVQIKIIDETSKEVKCNTIGEILIKGKNIMKGYYKRESITKETIVDGWLHSGDLGYIDEEGYLYLTGRKKNMIISGGINIYPEEIEGVLMQHPNIKDVCVSAEKHNLLGEIPVAKIVLKNPSCDISDIWIYCKAQLSNYKIPKRFDVVSELCKTYNGKIKRY